MVCWHTNSKWFWISCMSVNLLVDLPPYGNHTNIGITPLLDKIFFWNFLGHIYVSLLNSLLKLNKYLDISSSGLYVGTLVPNNSDFLVYLSVFHLAYLFPEIMHLWWYLQFYMRFFSESSCSFSFPTPASLHFLQWIKLQLINKSLSKQLLSAHWFTHC